MDEELDEHGNLEGTDDTTHPFDVSLHRGNVVIALAKGGSGLHGLVFRDVHCPECFVHFALKYAHCHALGVLTR